MASYTICSKLVEFCATNMNYLANILYLFAMDKPLKIARDDYEQSLVLKDYYSIADDHFEIYKWLDFLSKARGKDAFEKVKIPRKKYTGIELYIQVCANTVGARKLLTKCKQDYQDTPWERNSIQLFDKDESKAELQKSETISITAKNQSNITLGNRSPIKK